MRRRDWIGGTCAVALGSLVGARPATATPQKYSGNVAEVDRGAGRIVLGVVGPWRVVDGVTQVTRVPVKVNEATRFVRVERRPGPGPEGWIDNYVETPLAPWQVKAGDFVTATVNREGRQLVANQITVVVPGAP
jgi:hypothetical protein